MVHLADAGASIGDKSPLAKSNTAVARGFDQTLRLAPEKDFDAGSVQSHKLNLNYRPRPSEIDQSDKD